MLSALTSTEPRALRRKIPFEDHVSERLLFERRLTHSSLNRFGEEPTNRGFILDRLGILKQNPRR
jgi:hypothetical protein